MFFSIRGFDEPDHLARVQRALDAIAGLDEV